MQKVNDFFFESVTTEQVQDNLVEANILFWFLVIS